MACVEADVPLPTPPPPRPLPVRDVPRIPRASSIGEQYVRPTLPELAKLGKCPIHAPMISDVPTFRPNVLVSESELIVRGRATVALSRLSADEHYIVTEYRFQSTELLKDTRSRNRSSRGFVVSVLGGELVIGGCAVKFTNSTSTPLALDQDTLLFLAPSAPDSSTFSPVGGDQAVFSISGGRVYSTPRSSHSGGQPLNAFMRQLRSRIKSAERR